MSLNEKSFPVWLAEVQGQDYWYSIFVHMEKEILNYCYVFTIYLHHKNDQIITHYSGDIMWPANEGVRAMNILVAWVGLLIRLKEEL